MVGIVHGGEPDRRAADIANQILTNPAGYYFNVHSTLNPGGVARGQLVRTQ